MNLLLSLHINLGVTTGLISLSSNNLVVVRSKVHAITPPSIEVVLHVDAASNALLRADGPVLLESPGAVDRGLVGTGRDVDVVDAAVGRETALELGARGGVVGAAIKDL